MSKIKLYKYYVDNIEKPLVMEAPNRTKADEMLIALNNRLGLNLSIKNITDVRIETLILGESSKIKGGEKLIWVGTEYSKDGWINQKDYIQIVNNYKKQS